MSIGNKLGEYMFSSVDLANVVWASSPAAKAAGSSIVAGMGNDGFVSKFQNSVGEAKQEVSRSI